MCLLFLVATACARLTKSALQFDIPMCLINPSSIASHDHWMKYSIGSGWIGVCMKYKSIQSTPSLFNEPCKDL